MTATEDVQRQIAVTVIVAVEEPAFLVAVQRIVGGVEIEDDLPRRPPMRLQKHIDEQRLDRRRVVADLRVKPGGMLCDSASVLGGSAPAGSASTCPPAAHSPSASPQACRPEQPAQD